MKIRTPEVMRAIKLEVSHELLQGRNFPWCKVGEVVIGLPLLSLGNMLSTRELKMRRFIQHAKVLNIILQHQREGTEKKNRTTAK